MAPSRRSNGESSSISSAATSGWRHHIIYLIALFFLYVRMMVLPSSNVVPVSFDESTASGMAIGRQQNPPLSQQNILSIPLGKAENLPSVRTVSAKEVDQARKIYGGAGDGKHLGGFTELDLAGVSPAVWKHMLQVYGVHSLLDVGCGRGISTSWFALHNVTTMCVEGSHDAVEKSIFATIRPDSIVEHDFSRGPWWPGPTFDAVWAVEFLEHVGVNFHFNYISAFRKAALIFVTSSRWGGWHHVEVHGDEWWIRKYESYGFRYDAQLTNDIHQVAKAELQLADGDPDSIAPNGEKYNAQHIWLSMKVFINPVVAALPEHAHLFPEHGCYGNKPEQDQKYRECGTGPNGALESVLPASFYPLVPTKEQDEAWHVLIQKHIGTKTQ
jgi:Methyltransferase domain